MKTVLTILYGACLAATLTFSQAADSSAANSSSGDAAKKTERRQRPKLTEEQKQLRKEILAKYDTNKDGRLDRDERAKISDEDNDKLKKAGLNNGRARKPAAGSTKAAPKAGSAHSTGSSDATKSDSSKTSK